MRYNRQVLGKAALLAAFAGTASGQAIDFGDFTEWQGGGLYPPASGFDLADWQVRDNGATAVCVGNAVTTIFYDGSIDLEGQRVTGTIFPGTDDDIVGLVFGYTSDDDFSPLAEWLIVDWKATDQTFDFADIEGSEGSFHDVTGATFCAAGLRAYRARGIPSADELWGAIDLPENDSPPFAPGGAEELARALDIGRFGYDRRAETGYRFDIDLTATNLKLWVNGVLQFDLDGSFETEGFGIIEQYQDSGDVPDQGRWTGFSIAPSPGTTPDGPGLDFPAVNNLFAAGNIDHIGDESHPTIGSPPDENMDGVPDEEWFEISATGETPLQIVSPANRGDVAFNADDAGLFTFAGVGIPTVRRNATGDQLITAEIVPGGQFGGITGGMGVALAPSPADPFGSGNEANADFALAFFPFNAGWTAGVVSPSGSIAENPSGAAATNVASPNTDDQDGLYDIAIPGASPELGLLFVVGASNEDNVASAIPAGTGWRVAVRDNGSATFGSPQGFERDDFAFLYVPAADSDMPTLPAGAAVTGFDGQGLAETAVTFGSYTLAREGTGVYRLTVGGESPATGMLLLTANAAVVLDDPDGLLENDEAPLDHYLTYEPDGTDFLIQQVALAGANTVADGAFSFAFVPFGAGAGGCNAADIAEPYGILDLSDISAFVAAFTAMEPAADINGDEVYDLSDISGFVSLFGAGCP